MSKKELDAFRQAITRGPDRSPLFWWLVEQHDELTADGAAGRQDWKRHCATMARDGVVDAKGKPPNIEAARKAWQIVRKEVTTGRARRPVIPEPPPTPRSRQRGDWSPPITGTTAPAHRPAPEHNRPEDRPPPKRAEPVPSALPSTTTGSSKLDDLPPEVKAKFDRLRQQFAETDRKRFGTF